MGFLFLILYPASSPPPPPPFFIHTHDFVTHHLSHTTLSHTIFHTQLCYTSSFTHNFVTHHLSHTHLSHTTFVTHNFITHHLSHTHLSHTPLSHTQLHHTSSFHTTSFTHNLAGSGGALGPDWSQVTPRHFAWQVWRLATSTFVLHGRRGAWRHPPSFCLASVALGDMHLRFAWQAWRW